MHHINVSYVTNAFVYFPKYVINYLVSMYHVYHMYHVPYVSYVTNVCVFPHLSQKCDQLSCEYVSCVSMYHVRYVSYVTNVFVYLPKFVPKM